MTIRSCRRPEPESLAVSVMDTMRTPYPANPPWVLPGPRGRRPPPGMCPDQPRESRRAPPSAAESVLPAAHPGSNDVPDPPQHTTRSKPSVPGQPSCATSTNATCQTKRTTKFLTETESPTPRPNTHPDRTTPAHQPGHPARQKHTLKTHPSQPHSCSSEGILRPREAIRLGARLGTRVVDLLGRYSNWASWAKRTEKLSFSTPSDRKTTQRACRASAVRLTTAQVAELVDGYQGGQTVYELAARFGIHRVTVSAHLHRNGVTLRRQGLDDEGVQQAVHLYEHGWSVARIGTRLGVDGGTVWAALTARGLRMRDPQGRER